MENGQAQLSRFNQRKYGWLARLAEQVHMLYPSGIRFIMRTQACAWPKEGPEADLEVPGRDTHCMVMDKIGQRHVYVAQEFALEREIDPGVTLVTTTRLWQYRGRLQGGSP